MSRFTVLYTIFMSLCVVSCTSAKRMINGNLIAMEKGISVEKLTGQYNTQDALKTIDLWTNLESQQGLLQRITQANRDTLALSPNAFVQLSCTTNKTLHAQLVDGNTIRREIILKGKFKRNYFHFKRRFTLIPIPLYFMYDETRTLLGISAHGELVLLEENSFLFSPWVILVQATTVQHIVSTPVLNNSRIYLNLRHL